MATGGVFERGMLVLEDLGLTDVLLPFLLIFTIVFAVLQKTEMFGKTGKNFNVMIALILALGVVIPIFGAAADLWSISQRASFLIDGDTQAVIVVILVFALLVWFITKEEKTEGSRLLQDFGEMFKK